MLGRKQSSSPLKLAELLREKMEDPRDSLNSIRPLGDPLIVNRSHVSHIEQVTKYLFRLHLPETLYVSLALDPESLPSFMEFKAIVLHKVHSGIYYRVNVELDLSAEIGP
jgi:hypothetical protein